MPIFKDAAPSPPSTPSIIANTPAKSATKPKLTPPPVADGYNNPVPASPVIALPPNQNDLNQLNKNYSDLVIEQNLNNQPWFTNTNLVVGNSHLKKISTPITFTLNLSEFDSSSFLPEKKGQLVPSPLTLKLNCSLSRFSIAMKHIINKSNTRTGFHLTFWGMEPDTITGSGTTGVFMNQWGLAEIMSMDMDTGLDLLDELAGSASVAGNYIPGTPTTLGHSATPGKNIGGNVYPGGVNPDMFQVAAQDAFIEFLALFRNNGLTRFDNPGNITDADMSLQKEQLKQDIYSDTYGDTTYSRLARKNDIMLKGNIDFHYKSNLYQGYFKSLQWMLDSDHPFQWQFDFVFQVQKTMSLVYYTPSS